MSRMERDLAKMPEWQKKLLSFDYETVRIGKLKECIMMNQYFLNMIVKEHAGLFEPQRLPNGAVILKPEQVKYGDVVKMKSTLKSFMREWSAEVSVFLLVRV